MKECSGRKYRKSKTECVDCPADYTLIRSNLTCLDCWEHNDYKECAFTRLGYNVTLKQDSFLNISFAYSIKFYGEGKSLEKLNNKTIDWAKIFNVDSLASENSGKKCQKPVYKYFHHLKELEIRLNQCPRGARFNLRWLKTKVLRNRFNVSLMLNTSFGDETSTKIFKADDKIPVYSRTLRFVVWVLFLVFIAYLIFSEAKFINNQPLKLIGNFLKMVDFIQSLALLEVNYRVLTTKFLWLIQLIFSSPQFGLLEGYLNDQKDVRRERYYGKVYKEYGDKMAFNNYDLIILAYLLVIIIHSAISVLPCKLEKIRKIVEGFREFMYGYAFFEFFINILIDIQNIKKIILKGNRLAKIFLLFEVFILVTELTRTSLKLKDEEKDELENLVDKQKCLEKEGENKRVAEPPDTERRSLLPQKRSVSQKVAIGNNCTVRFNQSNSPILKNKQMEKRSKTLNGQIETLKSILKLKTAPAEGPKKTSQICKKDSGSSHLTYLVLSKFELLSDVRFMVIQLSLVVLREPKQLQFMVILSLQITMMLLALIKLVNPSSKDGKIVEVVSVFQEVSIAFFMALIVMSGTQSDGVEYLVVIMLALAIIMELASILIEVVSDVVAVVLMKLIRKKKKSHKNNQKSVQNEKFKMSQKINFDLEKEILCREKCDENAKKQLKWGFNREGEISLENNAQKGEKKLKKDFLEHRKNGQDPAGRFLKTKLSQKIKKGEKVKI